MGGCRELLSTELAALVGESYSRAYKGMVRAQQCTELQEVIQYKRAQGVVNLHHDSTNKDCADSEARMALIRDIWRQRIQVRPRSNVFLFSRRVSHFSCFLTRCRHSSQSSNLETHSHLETTVHGVF